jgi:hypothetical protein
VALFSTPGLNMLQNRSFAPSAVGPVPLPDGPHASSVVIVVKTLLAGFSGSVYWYTQASGDRHGRLPAPHVLRVERVVVLPRAGGQLSDVDVLIAGLVQTGRAVDL